MTGYVAPILGNHHMANDKAEVMAYDGLLAEKNDQDMARWFFPWKPS